MVGSVDIGLAFALISLIGNLGCLIIVFYFERHVAEEKARIFQQTWITTEETRKNAGYESDIDDMEDAEEVQVWITFYLKKHTLKSSYHYRKTSIQCSFILTAKYKEWETFLIKQYLEKELGAGKCIERKLDWVCLWKLFFWEK